MDTRRILSELRSERDRLDQAISALESLDRTPGGRRGRGAGGRRAGPRRRRHMSAASRKRISEVMKARWAERKRRGKA